MNPAPDLPEDIAYASAAYLVNVMPDILKLPPSEQFERIASHFEAALAAYRHGLGGWGMPEPSIN